MKVLGQNPSVLNLSKNKRNNKSELPCKNNSFQINISANKRAVRSQNIAFKQDISEIILDKKLGIVQRDIKGADGKLKATAVFDIKGQKLAEVSQKFKEASNTYVGFIAGKFGVSAILSPKDPEYRNIKSLVVEGTEIVSTEDPDVYLKVYDKKKIAVKPLSFKGDLYVTTGDGDERFPESVENAMRAFVDNQSYKQFRGEKTSDKYKKYNTFMPCAGKGSRLKDATWLVGGTNYQDVIKYPGTKLEGGISKAAMPLPAQVNGHDYALVQDTLANLSWAGLIDGDTKLHLIREPNPNGSASGLLMVLKDMKPDDPALKEPLIVRFCDAMSDIKFEEVLEDMEAKNSACVVVGKPFGEDMLDKVGTIATRGKTELDENGELRDKDEIVQYDEKPGKTPLAELARITSPERLNGTYRGSIGMFGFAPESLRWVKDKADNNPDAFKDADGEEDFSKGIIPKLINACNNGEITRNGKPLRMHAYVTESNFNDLGTTRAFIEETRKAAQLKPEDGGYDIPEFITQQYAENITPDGAVCLADTKKDFESFCDKYHLKAKGNILVTK